MLKYTIATAKAETDILTEYGVHVSGTKGLFGRPDLKTPTKFDWDYLNGEWVDLRSRRYKPREITMKCWLKGSSKQVAIDKMNTFFKAFSANTLIRLHVEFLNNDGTMPVYDTTKGLFYLVYLTKANVSKYKWRSGKQIVEFEITLVEPSPIKRIYQVSGTDSGTVTVTYNSASEFDIHWGDGGITYDCLGSGSESHAYTTSGKHFIIVTGVITDISAMTFSASTNEITITQIYSEI